MRKPPLLALAFAALLLYLASFAGAEVDQKGDLRVNFEGKFTPRTLPRQGVAPIAVNLGGHVATTDGSQPPQLRTIQIELNKAGNIDYRDLPACRIDQIQPATTQNALRACGASKVGEGRFSASVAIPEQSPFPSQGKLVAFNGTEKGKPVIFAHVYGTEPIPTSFTLALRIAKGSGTYGTKLTASLPSVTSSIAFVTSISMTINRTFHKGNRRLGYVSAGCPAPKGFSEIGFPLAHVAFSFADGRTLTSTLSRACRVRA